MDSVKLQEYKINKHKSIGFLYNNELSERDIKQTIPIMVETKRNLISRNKFNQGGQRHVLGKIGDTNERN